MVDQAGWRDTLESELRAAGRDLVVPPAADVTAAVRRRLEGRAVRRRRPGWRAVLAVAGAFLAVLIATPQGRAAVVGVFRFAGVEIRQEPGPVYTPTSRATLPGERRTSLEQARRQASFPILVPSALGQPGDVVVSDGGRVVSLIYRGTPYGQVRVDEFAGQPDQIYFEKIVLAGSVTRVTVNGTKGLWIKGPHELVYLTPDGSPATASAGLTTGNTLLWATPRVVLRLEGDFGQAAALAIAGSAR